MARLGVRSINELIGHTGLLDTRKGIDHWKAKGLDFSRVFAMPQVPEGVAVYHWPGRAWPHSVERLGPRSVEVRLGRDREGWQP